MSRLRPRTPADPAPRPARGQRRQQLDQAGAGADQRLDDTAGIAWAASALKVSALPVSLRLGELGVTELVAELPPHSFTTVELDLV